MDTATLLGLFGFLGTCSDLWEFAENAADRVAKMRDVVRRWGSSATPAQVRGELQEWSEVTDAQIQEAIDHHARSQSAQPPSEQQEQVRAQLVALVRSARAITTEGNPRSFFLGPRQALEQVLDGMELRRHAGERIHNWTLDRFLGRGAFGEVWRAGNPHDPTQSVQAFKFFDADNESYGRELAGMKKLYRRIDGHEHIVAVRSGGMHEETPYLAFEYVPGGSLEDWLVRPATGRHGRGRLNVGRIMGEIVDGMAAAHRQGIFHRDLKPSNILLAGEPKAPAAKITDFGLASFGDAGGAADREVAGTAMYLPPEALTPWSECDPGQQDVFALGCIWYQLLTGRAERPPYGFARRLAAAEADPQAIDLVTRCLAEPDHRYRSAVDLLQAMEEQWAPIELPPTVPDGPGDQPLYDVVGLVRAYDRRVGDDAGR